MDKFPPIGIHDETRSDAFATIAASGTSTASAFAATSSAKAVF
jgi:hypothetical protein